MIDGHGHACGRLLTAEGIETFLDENGLEGIVLCGGEPGSRRNYPYPMLADVVAEERVRGFINGMISKVIAVSGFAAHFEEENLHVLELSRELPGRVFNAYWVNPLEADCLEKMVRFYNEYSFVMLKMHQCWTDFGVESEMVERIFEWAGSMGVPVFIHLSHVEQAVKLAELANRCREARIIIAHCLWAREIIGRMEHDNVWFDLSSPQLYTMETLFYILNHCGPGRLILGSDTPYGLHNIKVVLKRLGKLSLAEDEMERITGGNIRDLV